VFIVMEVSTRRVAHFNVTTNHLDRWLELTMDIEGLPTAATQSLGHAEQRLV
jgi:hypothetical protein